MPADVTFTVNDRMAPRRAADTEIRKIAYAVLAGARARTPRRTGTLAAGWYVLPGRYPGVYAVRNWVPYGRYVEFGGGRGRPPVAMLGRTVAQWRARSGVT
jgi:hypothetical protein